MAPDNVLQTLFDLAGINGQRVAKYRSIQQSNKLELDLKEILSTMMQESEVYQEELMHKMSQLDGVTMSTRKPGNIFQEWQAEDPPFNSEGKEAFLASCEQEEVALHHAYELALSKESLGEDIRHLIERQQAELERELEHIQRYRDAQ